MKRDDGSFSGQSGRDPLAERLRHEAMAERPEFSEQLHHRTLQDIRRERLAGDAARQSPRGPLIWRWLAPLAAAAAIAAYVLTAPWLARSHRGIAPDAPGTIAENSAPPATADLSLNLGGIVYERLWPPGVTICLPTGLAGASPAAEPAAAQPAAPAAQPGSPDWLLATLDGPARNATAVLADLLPPEERFLIGLAQMQQ